MKIFAVPTWYVSKLQEEFWQQDWSYIESELKLPKDGVAPSHGAGRTAKPMTSKSIVLEISRSLSVDHVLLNANYSCEGLFNKNGRFAASSIKGSYLGLSFRRYEFVKDLGEDRPKQIAIYHSISGGLLFSTRSRD